MRAGGAAGVHRQAVSLAAYPCLLTRLILPNGRSGMARFQALASLMPCPAEQRALAAHNCHVGRQRLQPPVAFPRKWPFRSCKPLPSSGSLGLTHRLGTDSSSHAWGLDTALVAQWLAPFIAACACRCASACTPPCRPTVALQSGSLPRVIDYAVAGSSRVPVSPWLVTYTRLMIDSLPTDLFAWFANPPAACLLACTFRPLLPSATAASRPQYPTLAVRHVSCLLWGRSTCSATE